jgi:hypothetical protein
VKTMDCKQPGDDWLALWLPCLQAFDVAALCSLMVTLAAAVPSLGADYTVGFTRLSVSTQVQAAPWHRGPEDWRSTWFCLQSSGHGAHPEADSGAQGPDCPADSAGTQAGFREYQLPVPFRVQVAQTNVEGNHAQYYEREVEIPRWQMARLQFGPRLLPVPQPAA